METSKHIDRERRRTKSKTWASRMKVLRNPRTVTFLIAVGKLVTNLVWLFYMVVKVLRE